MGDKTGIEWTDATWNPIRGCSRVSEGCRNCYAESVANRFKGEGQPYEGLIAKGGQWNGNIKFASHLLDQPLRWTRPRRIFVNSMSDLFHPNVGFDLVAAIFAVMHAASHHTYQILTKRPDRMLEYFNHWKYIIGQPQWMLPPNIWLGVSVEDQATADERIPLLLEAPANTCWISAEPLLGPLSIENYLSTCCDHEDANHEPDTNALICRKCEEAQYLDWVVVGGESGKSARPMQLDWVRSLRDQCTAAETPFLFKQWGEYAPNWFNDDAGNYNGGPIWMDRMGKKSAGRMLDGRTWDQYPETKA